MTGRSLKRSGLRLGATLLGAVIVNLALFSLITLLSQEREPPRDEINASSVSLVSLKPPAPPETEDVKPPKPPQPKQQLDFKPDLRPPALDLGAPGLAGGIAFDLGMGDLNDGLDAQVVFNPYELDTQPETLVRIPPEYPYQARQRGIEGVVQIKLLVNADGTIGPIHVLSARPENIFEEAAIKGARRWKFKPGRIAGEPVTAWVVTNVRFTLN